MSRGMINILFGLTAILVSIASSFDDVPWWIVAVNISCAVAGVFLVASGCIEWRRK